MMKFYTAATLPTTPGLYISGGTQVWELDNEGTWDELHSDGAEFGDYELIPLLPVGVVTEYAACAWGVFGPLGQNAHFVESEIDAWRQAHRTVRLSGSGTAVPVKRQKTVINDVTFYSEWQHLATTTAEVDGWSEPE